MEANPFCLLKLPTKLEVARELSSADIDKAFRQASLHCHPDKVDLVLCSDGASVKALPMQTKLNLARDVLKEAWHDDALKAKLLQKYCSGQGGCNDTPGRDPDDVPVRAVLPGVMMVQ